MSPTILNSVRSCNTVAVSRSDKVIFCLTSNIGDIMSKKKIEVETSDGQSAILDLALTKTTGQVLLAAGLGLLSGLVVGKVMEDQGGGR